MAAEAAGEAVEEATEAGLAETEEEQEDCSSGYSFQAQQTGRDFRRLLSRTEE